MSFRSGSWPRSSRNLADRTPEQLLHSAFRVSVLAAVWTLVASVVGIGIGIASDSLALIAFGGVGILDSAGSATLTVHFALARTGARWADHAERVALHVIVAGLFAVGVATGTASVMHLLHGDGAAGSAAGTVITAASVVVLSALALRKRWLAFRIPSHALLADSHLSAVGAVLAGLALVGTATTAWFGWWWADPAAAIAVAIVAVRLAVDMARNPEPD